jgi:nucleoside phosphorylase
MFETNFVALFHALMEINFMEEGPTQLGANPTETKVQSLLKKGEPFLPTPFRKGYADPMRERLDSVFARLTTPDGQLDLDTLEALAGAVYQHDNAKLRPELDRFLAVISNLYRSFLDRGKRARLNIELAETLPPLAVFQSNPRLGPFTITCEQVAGLVGGGAIGVVSMPSTFADHPLLFGSLAHETGGHDVIHADLTLLPQLRDEIYSVFDGPDASWLSMLWDYWMDEAAADVYGVLNVGPSFGANLALLLSVFIAQQPDAHGRRVRGRAAAAAAPTLRTASGADDQGYLDPHPTDILRLALVQGAVENLTGLSPSTRATYVDQLSRLTGLLAPDVATIELAGFARVRNGGAMDIARSVPFSVMRDAARQVGAMIAVRPFQALDGHSIQDIETWDDADENAAVAIAGRLQTGAPILGLGDDAQIVAGLTLALLRQPDRYDEATKLASAALDDSYRSDPYWGVGGRDLMIVRPVRVQAEFEPDPFAEQIIDFNPLDGGPSALPSEAAAMVQRHAIEKIPWPDGLAPQPDRSFAFNGADAELPKADFVFITWTNAEANAMAAVMTPGVWAAPGSGSQAASWHTYTNQWASRFAHRSFGRAPAASNHYIGKYMPIRIGGKKVLLFKSNFHLARDDRSMPVKDMFVQIIEQTEAQLVITTGTAGAIGPKLKLGDVVIANTARFHCGRAFKKMPFNGKSFSSGYKPSETTHLQMVNSKLVAPNAVQLRPERHSGEPHVYSFGDAAKVGQPQVIVTTDEFEFDDKKDDFGLQKLGAMVEMDDAVLGLACQEMQTSTKWLAIRNASDEQMPTKDAKAGAAIYMKYGYWTSIPSALACWAMVLDH